MTAGRSGAWAVLAALAGSVAACGGGGAPVADAGAGDANVDSGRAPEPPAAPAPPMLLPCPTGWREVTPPATAAGPAPSTCDPWPEGGFVDCTAPDEVMWPGTASCTRVGTACPVGAFADDLPTDRPIVYVLAGAAAGGDGTPAAPFATLGAALGVAPAGSVVAVGKGDYDEIIGVPAGVTLWGACVAETTVRSSVPSTNMAVVTFAGRGAAIRNFRVAASARVGAIVDGALRDATLEAVVIEGSASEGLAASRGAHLTAHELVVRDAGAHAIEIVEGASAELSRVLVLRATETGIFGFSPGTTMHLEDVVVRDVRGAGGGRAFSLQQGAALDAARVVLENNTDVAAFASGSGTSATFTDVVVREVGTARGGMFGRAFGAQSGARIDVRRAWLEGLHDLALASILAGAVLTVEDAVVRDVRGGATGTLGRGAVAQGGGELDITRALFERVRDVGIYATDAGSMLSAVDVTLRDVAPAGSFAVSGRGVSVQHGAQAQVSRVVIERAAQQGVAVFGVAAQLSANDLVVRDTLGIEDGRWGDGLEVGAGGTVIGARVLVENCRRFGVLAGADSSLELTELTVRATLAQACALDTCADEPGFGVGIASVDRASATIADFAVDGAALCGVLVDAVAGLDLARGEVRGAPVGACVQAAGYDFSRLSADVSYRDNDRQLDTTTLPVPALGDPLAPAP